MQIIDLFSGIGGFSLAGRWMGWETVQFCEIDPFCQKVLGYHFPGVPISNDVKTLTADEIKKNGKWNPAEPTIIMGGFPCQPFSAAGKRKGTADDRHLWPEMLRIIREVRPDWVVGENVGGLLNWDGGVVFDQVQADLEDAGYEVTPFVLPACGVNAPHRRDRVWIVAHAGLQRQTERQKQPMGAKQLRKQQPASNPLCRRQTSKEHREEKTRRITETGVPGDWSNFPTQSPICLRNDGLPTRLVDITFPKWRNESIKALGNAIVAPVVFQIFKTINQIK